MGTLPTYRFTFVHIFTSYSGVVSSLVCLGTSTSVFLCSVPRSNLPFCNPSSTQRTLTLFQFFLHVRKPKLYPQHTYVNVTSAHVHKGAARCAAVILVKATTLTFRNLFRLTYRWKECDFVNKRATAIPEVYFTVNFVNIHPRTFYLIKVGP